MYKQINTKRIRIICIVFLVGLIPEMNAQDEIIIADMVTDRPDATESSSTVPLHALQIETGGYFESFKEGNVKSETIGYNTTLLRFGLLRNLEIRVGWNFEEGRTTVNRERLQDITSGFSPLLLGMKVEITEEKGLRPEIALLGHLMLPFLASTEYRPETTGVDFRFSFGHTVSERSSIGYNLGAQWGGDSPEANFVYTLAYGYSISEKMGLYAEVYGDFPENNSANHFWDAGVTYSIFKNVQLDATIGKSFTKGQDILVSAGVSVRIPK
jgi:hypothetical protein